jgi:hypothetical protein
MQTPLETLQDEQGLTQNEEADTVDLSAIARAYPVNQKTAVLDLNTFDATQLTLLEVLDMAETTGVPPERLGMLLRVANSKRMRLLYAMAWCIARRANPHLTFAEVCSWKLTVIGEVDKDKVDAGAKRAAIIVGAAKVSGLSPTEAGSLTVAELNAYRERSTHSNRAMRRAVRRRKAG